MLDINEILAAAPGVSTSIQGIVRYLGADPYGNAYLMRLDNHPLTAPFSVSFSELTAAIEAGEIIRGLEFELKIAQTSDELSDDDKDSKEKAVNMIAPLFETDDALFDSECRGRMFKERATECGVSPRMIRRLFYQYLWGGKSDLALAPQYANCGKQKQTAGSKRRGRVPRNPTAASHVSLPEVREQLEKGAKMFFIPGSRTLEEAFMETKKAFFKRGATIERGKTIKENLLPPEKLPTLRQFRTICEEVKTKLGIVAKIPRRIRQKRPDWEFRGSSRDEVLGPGHRFEIDATKLQVRLVSRYNRSKVLKNATLYVIVDIWSGAIVGYALSLQNASWALAAKSLKNCFTDKQEVFDRLGLDYTSSDWPCHHLCCRLGADRGEFVSDKAGLVPDIGIVVEIMPPMCPERKGKVESTIKNVKHGHLHRLPGRHPKVRERRESDGTDSAALTIDELERIIVDIIMGLNHEPVPVDHVPPEMIEEGETDITHIGLYRWGLEHYCGFTRKIQEKDVYANLMTKGVATLTPKGLFFKTQTYLSPLLVNARKYKPKSGKKRLLVDVRFDEHAADCIWFFDTKSKEWVQAVNNNEAVRRKKTGFYELEVLRDEVKRLRREAKDESLHRNSERDHKIRAIVKQAEEEAKEDRKGHSRASRKNNMRSNTQLEIEAGKMIAAGATTAVPEKTVKGPEETDAKGDHTVAPGAKVPAQPTVPALGQQIQTSEEERKSQLTTGQLALQMWRRGK
ncbi:hypothetical protein GMLC_10460 [Geomonas limicola]|uniref:Integrase catalytic domain-containing protein n=1 Tax=Geomonas limicola TaxID=2740186 RepID=A0A6V8N6L2_9BACT|nr:hypothetical protein [Geomonas limicola]GFO67467.1 hypothetical protein GMLC_10460 [Geomonas limicola]